MNKQKNFKENISRCHKKNIFDFLVNKKTN